VHIASHAIFHMKYTHVRWSGFEPATYKSLWLVLLEQKVEITIIRLQMPHAINFFNKIIEKEESYYALFVN